MSARFLLIAVASTSIFSYSSVCAQDPPLRRPDIQPRQILPQIPSPAGLEEYRRAGVARQSTISRVDIVRGTCAGAGTMVRIHGADFGYEKGRTVKIIRRLELANLTIVNWSDRYITAMIPKNIPERSFYEVVISESGRWISNLGRVSGCKADVTLGHASALAPSPDTLVPLFPRDRCRAVNLDTLDKTYERLSRPGAPPDGIFRIVDDRGTVVSFRGWSTDYIDTVFFYILNNWLVTVCYGPRMGNYDMNKTYRLMLWVDRDGQVPVRDDTFQAGTSSCFGGCWEGSLNRQFNHCREIPRLTELEFARVEPGIRDTRTYEEDVPTSTVAVWGIRRPHVHGPRTLYSVDDWPLFTTEADVRWAKRYFSRPTTVCTLGAFNTNSRELGSDETDGMQILVRR